MTTTEMAISAPRMTTFALFLNGRNGRRVQ